MKKIALMLLLSTSAVGFNAVAADADTNKKTAATPANDEPKILYPTPGTPAVGAAKGLFTPANLAIAGGVVFVATVVSTSGGTTGTH